MRILSLIAVALLAQASAWSSEASNVPDPFGLGEQLALISYLQDHQVAHADEWSLDQLRDAYGSCLKSTATAEAADGSDSAAAQEYKRLQYRAIVMQAYSVEIDQDATSDEIAAIEERAKRQAEAPAASASAVADADASAVAPPSTRAAADLTFMAAVPPQGAGAETMPPDAASDLGSSGGAGNAVVAEKFRTMPDFWQLDPRGHFADGGLMYCGPVAVSNSLAYLAHHGFPGLLHRGEDDRPQIDLINLLASPDYINTNPTRGSGPYNILRGVEKYVDEQGYRCATLAYEGWRKVGPYVKASRPDLGWIKDSILNPHGVVWLNIGWFTRLDSGHYRRSGGHFLTLVGFDPGNPMTLLIHNPEMYGQGAKASDPTRFELHLKPMEAGTCESEDGQTQNADGLYEVSGPSLSLGQNKVAILEEAMALVVAKP